MAVYTHVTKEELILFLKDYEIGELKGYEEISEGVENTNYKLIAEKGTYILTLYEDRVKKEDIPFFLDFMFHLSSSKINCPLPISNKKNKLISELNSKPASILSFLSGSSSQKITVEQTFEVGSVLAKIHLTGKELSIKRKNPISINNFEELIINSNETANNISSDLNSEISKEFNRIKENWPKDLPSGIIHADLFPDNVLFEENNISRVIDFCFSCIDFFAYDLGICINAWCFTEEGFDLSLSESLLKGYQSIRKLEDNEIKNLPILCSASSLRFLLTRLNDWRSEKGNAIVTPKNPKDFVKILKFNKTVANASEYGLKW